MMRVEGEITAAWDCRVHFVVRWGEICAGQGQKGQKGHTRPYQAKRPCAALHGRRFC